MSVEGQSLLLVTISDNINILNFEKAGMKSSGIKLMILPHMNAVKELIKEKFIDGILLSWEPPYSHIVSMLQIASEDEELKNIPVACTGVEFTKRDLDILSAFEISVFIQQPIPHSDFVESLKAMAGKKVRQERRLEEVVLGKAFFSNSYGLYSGTIKNISASGLLLETNDDVDAEYPMVDLKISLKGLSQSLQISAEIVRHEKIKLGGLSVAMRFIKFMNNSRVELKSYLRKKGEKDTLKYYI